MPVPLSNSDHWGPAAAQATCSTGSMLQALGGAAAAAAAVHARNSLGGLLDLVVVS